MTIAPSSATTKTGKFTQRFPLSVGQLMTAAANPDGELRLRLNFADQPPIGVVNTDGTLMSARGVHAIAAVMGSGTAIVRGQALGYLILPPLSAAVLNPFMTAFQDGGYVPRLMQAIDTEEAIFTADDLNWQPICVADENIACPTLVSIAGQPFRLGIGAVFIYPFQSPARVLNPT